MKAEYIISHLRFLRRFAAAILLWPVWLLGSAIRRQRLRGTSQIRILIFPQMNRVGDLVCATPVFRAIKKKYPQSHVAILISKKALGIVKYNPRIDEIIIHNSSGFVKRIRKGNFQWGFILTNRAEPSVLAFLGLIPHRVKTVVADRSRAEYFTDWLNTDTIEYLHNTYLPRHYLMMLERIGIIDAEEKKEVFLSPQGEKKADELFSVHRFTERDTIVGISVTAGNSIKEWGDAKFKELAHRLIEEKRVKIFFIGAKRDEMRIDNILRHFDRTSTFKAVDFALDELPSLLKRLTLFVSVDTGPIYICHALGVPLVDIIGPMDPREQPPNDAKSIQVLPPQWIQPTLFVMKRPGGAEEHLKTTEAISVDSVFEATIKLLP